MIHYFFLVIFTFSFLETSIKAAEDEAPFPDTTMFLFNAINDAEKLRESFCPINLLSWEDARIDKINEERTNKINEKRTEIITTIKTLIKENALDSNRLYKYFNDPKDECEALASHLSPEDFFTILCQDILTRGKELELSSVMSFVDSVNKEEIKNYWENFQPDQFTSLLNRIFSSPSSSSVKCGICQCFLPFSSEFRKALKNFIQTQTYAFLFQTSQSFMKEEILLLKELFGAQKIYRLKDKKGNTLAHFLAAQGWSLDPILPKGEKNAAELKEMINNEEFSVTKIEKAKKILCFYNDNFNVLVPLGCASVSLAFNEIKNIMNSFAKEEALLKRKMGAKEKLKHIFVENKDNKKRVAFITAVIVLMGVSAGFVHSSYKAVLSADVLDNTKSFSSAAVALLPVFITMASSSAAGVLLPTFIAILITIGGLQNLLPYMHKNP